MLQLVLQLALKEPFVNALAPRKYPDVLADIEWYLCFVIRRTV
jgi:hypothetical protein